MFFFGIVFLIVGLIASLTFVVAVLITLIRALTGQEFKESLKISLIGLLAAGISLLLSTVLCTNGY